METQMFLCPPLAELGRAAQEQVVLWDSNSLKYTVRAWLSPEDGCYRAPAQGS